jgi:hypothetical protein
MNQSNNTYQQSESAAVKLAVESRPMQAEKTEGSEVAQRKTNRKNWAGTRQGKLQIISFHKIGSRHQPPRWLCKCDCGKTKIICSQSLRAGTQSCGCIRIEELKGRAIHRKCNTNTYRTWKSMIQRCTNSNFTKYPRYGGRGITVCDEWKTFSRFYEDMGDRPIGFQLDRIDNNKGYSKGNCRWASIKTQARNRSNNRMIEINGESKTMAEWCEIYGISNVMVRMRIHRGINPVDALLKEPRKWQ